MVGVTTQSRFSSSFVAQGFQRLQPVLGAEGLHAADGWGLGQHGANHRQHGLGILRHQFTGHAVALGHPGTFIQQARRFKERRQVQLHRLAAQALELLDGITEQHRPWVQPKNARSCGTRHTEAERTRCAERRAVVPRRDCCGCIRPVDQVAR
jgi:hypothetical protein